VESLLDLELKIGRKMDELGLFDFLLAELKMID